MTNTQIPDWLTAPAARPAPATNVVLPAALEALRHMPVWLLWKSIPNDKGGKPRKVPCYTRGGAREAPLDGPNDKAQLVNYDAAVQALATGQFTGLALALGPLGEGQYLQGIDLDGVEEKGLQDIVDSLPGYVEISPSGKGYHALGIGPSFTTLGANASGVEVYSGQRFFTFTGQAVRGGLIALEIDELHQDKQRSAAEARALQNLIDRRRVDEFVAMMLTEAELQGVRPADLRDKLAEVAGPTVFAQIDASDAHRFRAELATLRPELERLRADNATLQNGIHKLTTSRSY